MARPERRQIYQRGRPGGKPNLVARAITAIAPDVAGRKEGARDDAA